MPRNVVLLRWDTRSRMGPMTAAVSRDQLHKPAYDMCGSSCNARWKSRTAASCSRCRLKQLPAAHLHTQTHRNPAMPQQSQARMTSADDANNKAAASHSSTSRVETEYACMASRQGAAQVRSPRLWRHPVCCQAGLRQVCQLDIHLQVPQHCAVQLHVLQKARPGQQQPRY